MGHFKVQRHGSSKGSITMKVTTKNGKVADAQSVKMDKRDAGTSDTVFYSYRKAQVQEIP